MERRQPVGRLSGRTASCKGADGQRGPIHGAATRQNATAQCARARLWSSASVPRFGSQQAPLPWGACVRATSHRKLLRGFRFDSACSMTSRDEGVFDFAGSHSLVPHLAHLIRLPRPRHLPMAGRQQQSSSLPSIFMYCRATFNTHPFSSKFLRVSKYNVGPSNARGPAAGVGGQPIWFGGP
jgi:hypothetical protein